MKSLKLKVKSTDSKFYRLSSGYQTCVLSLKGKYLKLSSFKGMMFEPNVYLFLLKDIAKGTNSSKNVLK